MRNPYERLIEDIRERETVYGALVEAVAAERIGLKGEDVVGAPGLLATQNGIVVLIPLTGWR